jgi:hypothetical protein
MTGHIDLVELIEADKAPSARTPWRPPLVIVAASGPLG